MFMMSYFLVLYFSSFLKVYVAFKQAKRKRIAELSVGLMPREHRRKSHWDFVLEEMAWLANDFMQVCQVEPLLYS